MPDTLPAPQGDDDAILDASEDIGSNPCCETPIAALIEQPLSRRAAMACVAGAAAGLARADQLLASLANIASAVDCRRDHVASRRPVPGRGTGLDLQDPVHTLARFRRGRAAAALSDRHREEAGRRRRHLIRHDVRTFRAPLAGLPRRAFPFTRASAPPAGRARRRAHRR